MIREVTVSGQAVRPEAASGWRAAVDIDASEWRVGTTVALGSFVAALLGVPATLAIRPDRALFDFLTREDSVFEWMQFAGYALAAVLGAVAARRFWSSGEAWLGRAFVLFALGNAFVAGEEISWGQRIFGWGTPADIDNDQRETTLHNAKHVLPLFNGAMLLIGLYGFAAPWLVRRIPARSLPTWARVVVPPLFLSPAFFVMFGYKLARFTAFRQPTFTAQRFGEYAELCLALALGTYGVLAVRVGRDRIAAAAAAGSPARIRVPRRALLSAAGVVLVAIAAVAVYQVVRPRAQVGKLTAAGLAQVHTGMLREQVVPLIGHPRARCWYYRAGTVCFDDEGTVTSSSFAAVRPGVGETRVTRLLGTPRSKCSDYRRNGISARLCFRGGTLVSKTP